MKKEEVIKGYKGFNKDLTCNGFQYKEGEIFEMKGDPKKRERGFHFCTEPLDILRYYNPAESVFHHVEGYGKSSTDNDDSKIAVSKIKIGAKISIAEFVKLSFEAILKRCKNNVIENSGDSSMASNSGYRSMASNSGDSSMASNSGDSSMAEVLGENSIAIIWGVDCKAKASLGSWICLSEWVMEDRVQIMMIVR